MVVGNPDLKGANPGVGTLLDGNPSNNFIGRAATFNPGGALTGARRITIAGTYAYILCDRGLVVVRPRQSTGARESPPKSALPRWWTRRASRCSSATRSSWIAQGLKVLDVTQLDQPRLFAGALVPLADARNVYVARTYAYVAGGKPGAGDRQRRAARAAAPRPQMFTADGAINDLRDVKIGAVDASVFAYLADGQKRFARAADSFARGFARFLRFQPARPRPS